MENKFKGTKGKWDAEITSYSSINGILSINIHEENDKGFYQKSICKINPQTNTGSDGLNDVRFDISTCKANAQLISKAPELLEMVLELLKELEFHGFRNSTTIYNAKNLIKEATTI